MMEDIVGKGMIYAYATINEMIALGKAQGISDTDILDCLKMTCLDCMKGYEDECREFIQKAMKGLKNDATRS